MNWPVITVVGIALIGLVIFLVRRNIKDEKDLEQQLKNDYTKPEDDQADVDSEEVIK
ncbi:FeoB-associated Cys-rich membrane protein [Ferruginibacter sp. SUN106]|uniref:FeoB-associated Cys-rich membrane protein n=1 Tax=Ferruginibacter sp. SUN106 TaxID=2978348 RepID=UPI003D35C715